MARVVLVDDDASIRRLVELALEELPIELVTCASVAEARAAIEAAPPRLVITDLMMPGETGFDLMHWLAAHPERRGAARVVVFSAGLDAPTRARLAGLDVWRELDKPVSVAALEACVREAVGLPGGVPPLAPDRPGLDSHFGGDVALYDAFSAQAVAQFAADVPDGDRCLAAGDWPALRRLAHSLKGVLALLGVERGVAIARALETAAAQGDATACTRGWPPLRALLLEMRGRS